MPGTSLEYIQEGDWPGVQRLVSDLQERLNFVPSPIYVGITTGAPAFTGTWVNFDGNTPPTHRSAYFYRDRGRVYLGGVIKTGVSGTSAFTLPVGFRPLAQTDDSVILPAFASGGIASVVIRLGGTVLPTNVGATAVATFVFLDGISFVAKG